MGNSAYPMLLDLPAQYLERQPKNTELGCNNSKTGKTEKADREAETPRRRDRRRQKQGVRTCTMPVKSTTCSPFPPYAFKHTKRR